MKLVTKLTQTLETTPLRAPTNPNEVFKLLSRLKDPRELDALLDQVEWSEATVHSLKDAFLVDDRGIPVNSASTSDMRSFAASILTSAAFQANILDFSLKAFPSKPRLLFVHIPKCGGTTINTLLGNKFATIDGHLEKREWYDLDGLFRAMRKFSEKIQKSEYVFISQHRPLQWFLTHLYRPGDKIFTFVRHPYDVVMSQINYIIKRFKQDPECRAPDTAHWAGKIKLDRFDPTQDLHSLKQLAIRIFDHPSAISFNLLSTYLGDGTAHGAISLIKRSNIEVLGVDSIHAWLRERWSINSDLVDNKSDSVIDLDSLDDEKKHRLFTLCADDLAVYEFITKGAALPACKPMDVSTPSAIVTSLYRALLNRDPDPSGMRNYVAAIDLGASLEKVVSRMISSAEFRHKFGTRGPDACS